MIKSNNSFRRISPLILSMLIIFLLSFVTPKPAQAFTVGEEKEAGEKLLVLVRQQLKFLNEPDITQYINGLAHSILTTAGPQYFNYHFYVIDNKVFNAFAAPSGLIFFHSGLIETMDTEGELVGVMAHEIGHVTSRHIAESIEKSQKINLGSLALVLAGIAMGGGDISQAVITGSIAAGASMELYFSRQHEEEADRLAFKWMKESNRNTHDLVTMLQKMRRISQFRQGDIPPYLLTHPDTEKRLSYVQDLVAMSRDMTSPPQDNFAFLRIKSRILSLTRNPTALLPRYLNNLSQAKTQGDPLQEAFAHYGLAQVHLSNADFNKARESLLKVIALFPDKAILQADLGNIYFQEGNYDKALEILTKARQADRNCAYTAFYLARAYEQKGELKTALALYNELLPILPEYSRLHYHLGQVKAAMGEKGQGHYSLGLYFWHEGNQKNAVFHLQEALKNLPEDDGTRKKAELLLETIKKSS